MKKKMSMQSGSRIITEVTTTEVETTTTEGIEVELITSTLTLTEEGNKPHNTGATQAGVRRLFDVFEQKTELMRLLDVSSRAEGVRIYIGGESHVVPFEELSVVTAPYEVDGRVVGTLGVIGPTRMAYERMIQIVDITSRLVGNALSAK